MSIDVIKNLVDKGVSASGRAPEDVMFVAIGGGYWMSYGDFMSLTRFPNIGQTVDALPAGFKVVFRDWAHLEHHMSVWRYHEPLRRPEKRYYIDRRPRDRTLGDFVVRKYSIRDEENEEKK